MYEPKYYWVRWGKEWVIAIHAFDEDEKKMKWYCNGMEIITPPDEFGNQIIRETSIN